MPDTADSRPHAIPWWLIGLPMLCAAALLGVLSLDVRSHRAIPGDSVAGSDLHSYASPLLDRLADALTFIGSAPVVIGLLLVSVIFLFLRGHRREAGFLALAVSGSAGIYWLLNTLFHRTRPHLPWSKPTGEYSFPSGHSQNSLVLYCGLAIVIWVLAGRTSGIIALTLAVLLVIGIGLSRIYLGYHFLSDVLAGYSAGVAWLLICAALVEWRV